jgi:peroxiredoxin Q/BCP
MLKLALLCAAGLAMAAGMRPSPAAPDALKVGDPAPPFSLPGSDGKTHALADYRGKTVVLAWFPKAFTGG